MGRWPWVLSESQADTQPQQHTAVLSPSEPSLSCSTTQVQAAIPIPDTPLKVPVAQTLLEASPAKPLTCCSASVLNSVAQPTGMRSVPALPLICCVTLAKSLNLLGLFPYL